MPNQALKRASLAASLAAVGLGAGSVLGAEEPVSADWCENDACQRYIIIDYCADGHYNAWCDMVGSSCSDGCCDPEQPCS